MTNTEQLKVGDRVMLLPTINSKSGIFNPFTICVIDHINFRYVRIQLLNVPRYLTTSIENVQPLPTKFDGWEEE